MNKSIHNYKQDKKITKKITFQRLPQKKRDIKLGT